MIAIDPEKTKTLYAATDDGCTRVQLRATCELYRFNGWPNDVYFVHDWCSTRRTDTLYAGTRKGVMKSIMPRNMDVHDNGFSQSTYYCPGH